MCNKAALRHNPAVKLLGERLKAGGLTPKAVVAGCMYKLAIQVFGVLRSGRSFDFKLALPGVEDQDGIHPEFIRLLDFNFQVRQ